MESNDYQLIYEKLIEALQKFDDGTISFDQLMLDFNTIIPPFNGTEPHKVLAEWLAFVGLFESKLGFEPMIATDAWSCVSLITEDIINYWQNRIYATKNSVLKAKYAGLVWHFGKVKNKKDVDFKIFKIFVDETLKCDCKNRRKHDMLEYALGLALKYKDEDRADKIREIAANDFAAMRAVQLIDKVGFSTAQLAKIIERLEAFFEQNSDSQISIDIVRMLASCYKKLSRLDDIEAYLLRCRKMVDSIDHDWCKVSLLESLIELYKSLRNMGLDVKKEIDEALLELQKAGLKMANMMPSVSTDIDMKDIIEELQKQIDALDNLDDAINLITEFRIRGVNQIRDDIENGECRVLDKLFDSIKISNDGIPIASISSEDDKIIFEMAGLDAQMLNHCIGFMANEIIKKFGRELCDRICESPLIDESHKHIIKIGTEHYMNNDFLSAIHVIIPQIEHCLRNLLDGPALKITNNGQFEMKYSGLLELLRERFGEDIYFHMKSVLDHKVGLNIRHEICHGLASSAIGHWAAIVLRVLLIIIFKFTPPNP